MMIVFEFKDVIKSFGEGIVKIDVLKNINFEVVDGEFLVLLGFFGIGKMILINLMVGIEMFIKGSVIYKGKLIIELLLECGVIFQNYLLMLWLMVISNVVFVVDIMFLLMFKVECVECVVYYVKMVGLLYVVLCCFVELLGGMCQWVNVVCVLVMDFDMLLLDEFLLVFDVLIWVNFVDEIENIWFMNKKICVLIINDVDEVILFVDWIILLNLDGILGEEIKVNILCLCDWIEMNNDEMFKVFCGKVINYLMDVGIEVCVEGLCILLDVILIYGVFVVVVKV